MKTSKKIFFYLLLLLLSRLPASAQNSFDSSFADAVSVYVNTIGTNRHLFNGSEYIDYDHRIKGNPFFGSLYFTNGSIVYDEIIYHDVKMAYDILNDEVVIKDYNNSSLLLIKEKVSAFNFPGHYFVKIVTDSAQSGVETGFYNVLYDGTTKLFAKRKKEITEKISPGYLESSFTEKDQHYIIKDSIYYPVSNRRDVLNVLKDRKSELSKFIRQYKIKFSTNLETAVLRTVAYYDSLNIAK